MAIKRSLILAGGGVKVAFQAGVLQVWLDEAGLTFDHADGASGGTFNLAMWAQGMSGKQIADAWRRTRPVEGIALDIAQFPKLLWARSLFTLDGYRQHVFPGWGLDWPKINASPNVATFNAYNFSKQELVVFSAKEMSEDKLCACVSLPMWFPPMEIDGDEYIDAVYATDAHVEEAIWRGADEIWAIWTVSTRGEWNDGFIANYFQIIEASANSNFRRICRRIEDSNATLAKGGAGEFGRKIELKILQAEVPMHYLVNFSQDRLVECVNLGVQTARKWCKERGTALRPGDDAPTEVHTAQTKLQFGEQMKGFVALGESEFEAGFAQGKANGTALSFGLTIKMDGVNRFVTDPRHEAVADGWIDCAAFGGKRPVVDGMFNLFVEDGGNPRHRQMLYRLWFYDGAGKPLTLLGFKSVKDDPGFDVWSDTTTLYTRIIEGHGTFSDQGKLVGSGVLKLHMADFLKELTTFRVEGPTLADRTSALARFGKLFLGKLWDVYASHLLSYGPI
ncbi:MAG TPA: patatin-like phospholipase family protein [Polyangiaceae bacterium]|jgi:predicted acylesterase/phospholipase RssA|nr:patatin-like phospholipase family protein [Polyangiaceae bacterium]